VPAVFPRQTGLTETGGEHLVQPFCQHRLKIDPFPTGEI
jgi:hypothetical protein